MSAKATQTSPGDGRAQWPDELRRDCEANRYNGCVGSVLVSQSERVRVWHLILPPGKRCAFHRHVLDYFWTCHTSGRARGYFEDGHIADVEHFPGHTKHFHFGPGEYLLHSVENVGPTELVFTTVEFLQSDNPPLPVPKAMFLTSPDGNQPSATSRA